MTLDYQRTTAVLWQVCTYSGESSWRRRSGAATQIVIACVRVSHVSNKKTSTLHARLS